MAGRYFEDWTVGDRIAHEIRRTVTETDNLLFSTMTHNPQPLHLDVEAAKASEFGQILVNGTFTFALMVGLSVGETTLGTLVANLGYDKLVMPSPVFIGDTMRAETEVVELRESRSRPTAGLVTAAAAAAACVLGGPGSERGAPSVESTGQGRPSPESSARPRSERGVPSLDSIERGDPSVSTDWARWDDALSARTPVAALREVAELNIGHFIIGEAVFVGLEASVRRMRASMDEARATSANA